MSKLPAPKSSPPFSIDELMRDTVALERIADAFGSVADALTMCAKLMAQEYEKKYPVTVARSPITVFDYKPERKGAAEETPIPLEDEVEIDPLTRKAAFKRKPSFNRKPS